MRTVYAFLLASLFPAVASAQSAAFPAWERPAVGVFLGSSGNGDQNSGHSAAEPGFVFDTPVVFGYRLRADASRVAWRFDDRDYRGNLRVVDTVTLRSIRLGVVGVRYASSRVVGYAGGGYGLYRYEYAHSPLHNPWRGGIHGVAGLESISPGQRYALDLEVRLHAINGTGQPPVVSTALFKLDAAIGLKVRL